MPTAIQRLGLWLARGHKSRTTAETLPRYQSGRPYHPRYQLTQRDATRDAYTTAGIVYACVRILANTSTSVPINAYTLADNDAWHHDPKHPLQALLDNPNPELTRRRIYTRVVQHLTLTGNAILTKVRVPKRGPTTSLWPISPDLIRVVPDSRDLISHYELTVDGKRITLEPRDVIHIQIENPDTPYWGLGPLQAAMLDVNLYKGNKGWNLRTVERGAVTPGVLEVPEDLSDPQFKKLREQLDQRSFGNEDAGRELILGSGMKYHRMALTGEELGFLESMRFGREEIAMIFGVPPALLTPDNATLANVEAYDRQFWRNTIVPLNLGIADTIGQSLVPEFGDPRTLTVEHDYSRVPAMQDNMGDQARVAERLVRAGFTVAGVNRLLDLGFDDDEVEAAPPPRSVPRDEQRSVKSVPAAERARAAWDAQIAQRVTAEFQAERDVVAAAWNATPTLQAVTLAVMRRAPAWEALIDASLTAVSEHFARLEYDALAPKKRKAFDPTLLASGWAQTTAARHVTFIADTTIKTLAGVIADGIANNLTTPQIASALADTYDSWMFTGPGPDQTIDARAMTIARTEVNAAVNYGHTEGARQVATEFGLDLEKVWSSAMDPPRARSDHMALHGVAVGLDDVFPNGLMFPGDPNGPPEEIVNCFPADTHVDGVFLGAFRRWFSGDLVEVLTREGKHLAGTPNHPVLTDEGWVALKDIGEGDHLVCHGPNVDGAVGHDVEARPSQIGQVFDSFAMSGGAVRVDGRRVNFHGETPDGQVDVVSADGKLRAYGEAPLVELSADSGLPPADASQAALMGGSLPAHLPVAGGSPSPSGVRGSSERASLLGAGLGHTRVHCLTAVARGDAGAEQEAPEGCAADAAITSEGMLGLAGRIARDEVVRFGRREWSGHVYNLSTATGAYTANNIVVHNCRCLATHRVRRPS